jgi:hypothetical protein
MAKNELTQEVVEQATESKTASAVLNASLQFANSLDRSNEKFITELKDSRAIISELRVDQSRLNNKIANQDSIAILQKGPFGSERVVIRNIDDSRVKDLLNESLVSEIKELKEDVLAKNSELYKKDSYAQSLLNRLDEKDEVIRKLKFDFEIKSSNMEEEYRKNMLSDSYNLQKYKEKYAESLNQLRLQSEILENKLVSIKKKLSNNWFIRRLTKGLHDLINDLVSFEYTSYKLTAV